MSTYRLDRLIAPRALAVVGASPREASVGRHVVANIIAAGFAGPVHVVNPNYGVIEGISCVKSIDDIAGTPDVVGRARCPKRSLPPEPRARLPPLPSLPV